MRSMSVPPSKVTENRVFNNILAQITSENLEDISAAFSFNKRICRCAIQLLLIQRKSSMLAATEP